MRVSGDFVAFLSAIVDGDGDQGGWGYCRSAGGTGGSANRVWLQSESWEDDGWWQWYACALENDYFVAISISS